VVSRDHPSSLTDEPVAFESRWHLCPLAPKPRASLPAGKPATAVAYSLKSFAATCTALTSPNATRTAPLSCAAPATEKPVESEIGSFWCLLTANIKTIVLPDTRNERRKTMNKSNLKRVSPATVNLAVPQRPKNAALRTREHLTGIEVEKLIATAKRNRYGQRDALMILLAYRHGLRAAEVCDLRWEQVDFKNHNLHVRRIKNGLPSTHPLTGRELRELRKLKRETSGPNLFMSERGAPMDATAFSTMVRRAGTEADLGIKIHAHMLRHACGYKLANDGTDTKTIKDYLGHSNIANTARYTALSANRFKGLFRD